MLAFPQLVHYPFTKTERVRTVVNLLADGRRVAYGDPDEQRVEWELPLGSLTEAEWAAVEALFVSAEGRLREFTFLDPTANLLLHSEDLSAGAWVTGPLLSIEPGVGDPLATNRASRLTNTGQAAQRIAQTIAAPAWFQYSFSVWIRANSAQSITSIRETTSGSAEREAAVDGQWRRIVSCGNLELTEETMTFALEIPAGGQVEVFGMQVDGQLTPSAYKKTTNQGGVYSKARFSSDRIEGSAERVSEFAGVARIVAVGD